MSAAAFVISCETLVTSLEFKIRFELWRKQWPFINYNKSFSENVARVSRCCWTVAREPSGSSADTTETRWTTFCPRCQRSSSHTCTPTTTRWAAAARDHHVLLSMCEIAPWCSPRVFQGLLMLLYQRKRALVCKTQEDRSHTDGFLWSFNVWK